MLLLWSSSQRLPPFALAFALQTCSKATSPSLLGHHWAGKCSLVFNNSLLQLSIPYLMFVTLENLCIACAFGGFLGLKFGYRDGVRGGGGKGIEGIRSGLSLAAAWSSCSVTINPKYSFFWTFLMAHVTSRYEGRRVTCVCLRLCLRLCNCSNVQFGVRGGNCVGGSGGFFCLFLNLLLVTGKSLPDWQNQGTVKISCCSQSEPWQRFTYSAPPECFPP